MGFFSALALPLHFSEEQLELLEFHEMMLSPGKAGAGRCLGPGEPVLPAEPATTYFLNTAFYKWLNC